MKLKKITGLGLSLAMCACGGPSASSTDNAESVAAGLSGREVMIVDESGPRTRMVTELPDSFQRARQRDFAELASNVDGLVQTVVRPVGVVAGMPFAEAVKSGSLVARHVTDVVDAFRNGRKSPCVQYFRFSRSTNASAASMTFSNCEVGRGARFSGNVRFVERNGQSMTTAEGRLMRGRTVFMIEIEAGNGRSNVAVTHGVRSVLERESERNFTVHLQNLRVEDDRERVSVFAEEARVTWGAAPERDMRGELETHFRFDDIVGNQDQFRWNGNYSTRDRDVRVRMNDIELLRQGPQFALSASLMVDGRNLAVMSASDRQMMSFVGDAYAMTIDGRLVVEEDGKVRELGFEGVRADLMRPERPATGRVVSTHIDGRERVRVEMQFQDNSAREGWVRVRRVVERYDEVRMMGSRNAEVEDVWMCADLDDDTVRPINDERPENTFCE